MSYRSPARWLALLPAMATWAALAQPAPDSAEPLAYRSTLEGYRRFADEKPLPWKEANDTVYQRGGWRGYAKEATPAAAESAPHPEQKHPAAPHAMPATGRERP